MKWCQSCVLPDTRPNLRIDDDGICNACKMAATRPDIDWNKRRRLFDNVVANAKRRSHGYDCLIPVSGGKDSHWQVIKALEQGLTPLAITWRPPGRTSIGQDNLDNLVQLGVDHIDYQFNPKTERHFLRKALERFGSTGIPMHMGIFNMPLMFAVRFNIPLILWGENSAFEYGAADEAHTGFRLDHTWLKHYGVTHGTTPDDWTDDQLTKEALTPYFGPTPEELDAANMHACFMSYYFPWTPQLTHDEAVKHGFKARVDGPRLGHWNYADIDDDFISIHHYPKWHKFGFTRLFDNLSIEIRNGRMTRDDAIGIIRDSGDQTPHDDIEMFCDFVEMSVRDFHATIERFRNHDIWHQRDGVWTIPDFLIDDWNWQ